MTEKHTFPAVRRVTAHINNVGSGWTQVTLSHSETSSLTEADIESAFSTPALISQLCPRPCNHRPDVFAQSDCIAAGECGCAANPAPVSHPMGINWSNPADPSVKFLVEFDVEEFVAEYEFCTDDGYYTPTQQERMLLEDAAQSILSIIHEGLREIAPTSAPEVSE